jgi:hypothetical protein
MHVYPQRNLMGFHNLVLHDGYLGNARKTNMPAAEHWKNIDDYLPGSREKLNYDADIYDAGLDVNSWVARTWIYPEHLHSTNWVVNKSIDFLRKKDLRKPFFLKMSFIRPHSPLEPPKIYYDRYIN